MISTSQAVEILKNATYIPEKKIEAIARNLIDAGIIPKSRGRRVALMNLEQFCALMIAIHVASPGKDAAVTLATYFDLASVSGDKQYNSAGEHITLLLEKVMQTEVRVFTHCSIMIMLSHPRITINSSFDGERSFNYGHQTTDDKPRSYVEIPGATLFNIADQWRRTEAEAAGH